MSMFCFDGYYQSLVCPTQHEALKEAFEDSQPVCSLVLPTFGARCILH